MYVRVDTKCILQALKLYSCAYMKSGIIGDCTEWGISDRIQSKTTQPYYYYFKKPPGKIKYNKNIFTALKD